MKVNEMSFEARARARHALDAAEKVVFCFSVDALVYALVIDEIPFAWLREGRESSKRGSGVKARIRPTVKQKAAILPHAHKLGTVEELENAYRTAYEKATGKPAPRNMGWTYECAITEKWARKVWEPDSVPFWVAPDVEIDGTGYQVKGDGAEYFTNKCLQAAMDWAGM